MLSEPLRHTTRWNYIFQKNSTSAEAIVLVDRDSLAHLFIAMFEEELPPEIEDILDLLVSVHEVGHPDQQDVLSRGSRCWSPELHISFQPVSQMFHSDTGFISGWLDADRRNIDRFPLW